MGNNQFGNFWEPDNPFTLTSKCLEIHHWRNAARTNSEGELYIDEDVVTERVRQSLDDREETAEILRVMMRHRDPAGVYLDGGCIDNTREYPRMLCPGTTDLKLPTR